MGDPVRLVMAGVDPRDVAVAEFMAAGRRLRDLGVAEEQVVEYARACFRVRVYPGEVVAQGTAATELIERTKATIRELRGVADELAPSVALTFKVEG